MKNKSMLTLLEYSTSELTTLINFACQLKRARSNHASKKHLQSKKIALIFQKPSTRTRIAASIACFEEGAYSEFFNINTLQLGHKESIADTARIFGRMFDGVVFRGFEQSDLNEWVQYAGIPTWNGLTNEHHPTQALADLMTIQEKFNTLHGIKITFLGDARNNVASSLMIGCVKLGVSITFAAPSILWPDPQLIDTCQNLAHQSGSILEFQENPKKSVQKANVLYTDTWVSMGEPNSRIQERMDILHPYQINEELISATGNSDVVFMHCLPAEKGKEVTAEVFESPRSLVFEEAENKLHTFKSIMISSLCGIESLENESN